MTRVKIKLTKDVIAYLKSDTSKAKKISKGTIMFADELNTSDFASFAEITEKVAKETKKEVEKVWELDELIKEAKELGINAMPNWKAETIKAKIEQAKA